MLNLAFSAIVRPVVYPVVRPHFWTCWLISGLPNPFMLWLMVGYIVSMSFLSMSFGWIFAMAESWLLLCVSAMNCLSVAMYGSCWIGSGQSL